MRVFCKWIAVILSFTILGGMRIAASEAIPVVTSASAAVLMDQYGQILYAQNANTELPMASTTKIMTAWVALELADPEQRLTVPKEAVGIEGSSAYLMEGESMTLRTLLYALLLQSANDAAVAIAVCLSGSVDAFVQEMNRKAERLGLIHTHFTNPHGLDDPAHYTSATDLAKITVEALRNPLFAQIVSTIRYQAPVEGSHSARLFINHNRLLKEYDGCIGVKTGYTKRTGRCLVSAARRDGITMVAVTLNDPDDWQTHKRLLDYGFSSCESVPLAPALGIQVTVPMVGGTTSSLTCANLEAITLTLPQNSCPEMVIQLPHFIYAGIPQKSCVGYAVWYLNGEQIARCPLYSMEEGTKISYPPTLWERIVSFWGEICRAIREIFKN